ncbi:Glutathione-regulated potassium-efflux system protein KefB [compost metagenome]
MPVLAAQGRINSETGRATFAVLLAQDVAVAPILITVTVLATLAQSHEGDGDDDRADGDLQHPQTEDEAPHGL